MEYKLLGFPDSMKLAEILSRYVDIDSLDGKSMAEVILDLFSTMEEIDTGKIISLLLVDYLDKNEEEIILKCGEGLINNEFLTLVQVYKQIGFA